MFIKHIYNTFTVSFASSITKNVVFSAQSKFAIKLICWIALGLASRTCSLLKSVATIL